MLLELFIVKYLDFVIGACITVAIYELATEEHGREL